jgi:predicted DNA-binding transcriptional regulator AlpA
MWLWRRLHDDSGFPRPMMIAGRRLWRMSDLIAWEREHAAVDQAEIA